MSEHNGKGRRNWRLEEIDFSALRREQVVDDERLFYLLASSSFVETLADLYTRNLIDHYRGDGSVAHWLEEYWQKEEVQHGRALKAYVRTVWPEFDWEKAYAGFAQEYGAVCTMEELEPSRALEMAARCAVETGTSTLYRSLYDYTREPLLRQILGHIKADEVRHFTQFKRMFRQYNGAEGNGSWRVGRAMLRRVLEMRGDDTYIAFKHVYLGRHPGQSFREEEWLRFSKATKRWARGHFPFAMAADMLLEPVPLPGLVKRLIRFPLVGIAKLAML